jgi:hypothetical protein
MFIISETVISKCRRVVIYAGGSMEELHVENAAGDENCEISMLFFFIKIVGSIFYFTVRRRENGLWVCKVLSSV